EHLAAVLLLHVTTELRGHLEAPFVVNLCRRTSAEHVQPQSLDRLRSRVAPLVHLCPLCSTGKCGKLEHRGRARPRDPDSPPATVPSPRPSRGASDEDALRRCRLPGSPDPPVS